MISFKPQKVLSLDKALELKTPKIHGDYILSIKYEGWYTTILYDGFKFHPPKSSNNRTIPSLVWVTEKLNDSMFSHSKPFMIIAEAYLEDTPFEILNGIFNRSKGECDCFDAVFKVHDIVPLDIAVTAYDRLAVTNDFLKRIDLPFLHFVMPLYIGAYDNGIWKHYFDLIAGEGGEGIVMKRAASFYQQGKRNADLLKDKIHCTRDLLADSLEESVGSKGNPSLTLISKRKNGTLVRTVISKHSDQLLFRSNPESVIGKVVEVHAMEEYEDLQLRQATFKHIRHDKLPTDID
jgi:ATP-dependent DNA ligase